MSDSNSIDKPDQTWLEINWHPLCGIVYLIICLTDFMAMPIYYEWSNARVSAEQAVQLAVTMKDGPAQIEALKVFRQERAWQPITLGQNGLFHLAFGAILGAGIWSRGRQQGAQALNDLTSQIQSAVSTGAITPPTLDRRV